MVTFTHKKENNASYIFNSKNSNGHIYKNKNTSASYICNGKNSNGRIYTNENNHDHTYNNRKTTPLFHNTFAMARTSMLAFTIKATILPHWH